MSFWYIARLSAGARSSISDIDFVKRIDPMLSHKPNRNISFELKNFRDVLLYTCKVRYFHTFGNCCPADASPAVSATAAASPAVPATADASPADASPAVPATADASPAVAVRPIKNLYASL